MRQPRTYASDSPLGRLVADLKRLRKGDGLTRSKVAAAQEVLRLPVVRGEAKRLERRFEDVAYALVVLAIHGLKSQASRDYLINAYALDNTPPGKNISDRRSRFGLSESQVRQHEDAAIEEVSIHVASPA